MTNGTAQAHGSTCAYDERCAFGAQLQGHPLLRIKYATLRGRCRDGGDAACARYAAYAVGGRPADYLLPTGALDLALADETPRVLIVDDMPVFRKVLEAAVGAVADFAELVTASGVTEAVAKIGSGQVDLVVTDYHMPGGDGVELVRALRDQPHTADVPVIIFTTEEDTVLRGDCLALGRVRWVVKSSDRAVLACSIREMLFEGRA